MLHGAAQTEPGSERYAAGGRGRCIAQIESYDAEAAALDQEVGRPEGMLGVMGAADPQETVQTDTGGGGGSRVEGIFGIHQGAGFLTGGGLGKDGEQQTGASGGSGTV